MKNEIWRDIAGYEGLYQVSNMGRVKSLNYHHTGEERILKPKVDGGYLRVILYNDGKRKLFLIHRLVAQAFIPNSDNLPQINHKDENKKNNFVFVNEDGSVNLEKSNLEYCTQKYNINYGTGIQRRAESRSIPVLQLGFDGSIIKRWNSTVEAQREGGFKHSAIVQCCQGKRNIHHGYRWQYETEYKKLHTKNEGLF